MLDADDVIAGVDMRDFAGHAARQVGQEKYGGLADVVQADVAAQRGVVFIPLQNVAEIADAGGGECLDRAGGNRVDADILDAEIGGQTEASSAALASPITL